MRGDDPLQQWFARPFGKGEKKAMSKAFLQNESSISHLLEAMEVAPKAEATRMAWLVEEMASGNPEALEPHKNTIITLILQSDLQPVLRNLLKAMLLYRIDEHIAIALYDRCLRLATNSKNEVAVRCNALSLAHHIAKQYHGLEQEVFALAESLQREGSAGLRARVRKLLMHPSRT